MEDSRDYALSRIEANIKMMIQIAPISFTIENGGNSDYFRLEGNLLYLEAALGIGVFSIGPMISFSVSDNMTWDFKPQYAPSMKGKYAGDDAGIFGDLTLSGNAFVIGNSLVFGDGSKGFDFSLDIDYLTGKFDEVSGFGESIDDDSKYNSFRLGVGIRYNF